MKKPLKHLMSQKTKKTLNGGRSICPERIKDASEDMLQQMKNVRKGNLYHDVGKVPFLSMNEANSLSHSKKQQQRSH